MNRVPFNLVATDLAAKERKAVMDGIWEHGAVVCTNLTTQEEIVVCADADPADGEFLFYVSFPGAIEGVDVLLLR